MEIIKGKTGLSEATIDYISNVNKYIPAEDGCILECELIEAPFYDSRVISLHLHIDIIKDLIERYEV